MNAKQHISFALYSSCLLGAGVLLGEKEIATLSNAMAVFVGSLLPDIDHPKSIAGHLIPLWIIKKAFPKMRLFRHGGITHTLLINVGVAYLGYKYNSMTTMCISFGYFTHLVADHITGNKLPMLYFPFKRR